MWKGDENKFFITFPHEIACGKVIKTNIFITFPHEIACGKVIKTNILITFPHEIARGKVMKIFAICLCIHISERRI